MSNRRLKLWNQDPKCHWCHVQTRIYPLKLGESPTSDFATIDHIYSRLDPRRKDNHSDCVLSCLKCNIDRNKRELSLMAKVFRDNHPDAPKTLVEVSLGKELPAPIKKEMNFLDKNFTLNFNFKTIVFCLILILVAYGYERLAITLLVINLL